MSILCSFFDKLSFGFLGLGLVIFNLLISSLQFDLILEDCTLQSVVLALIDHEG